MYGIKDKPIDHFSAHSRNPQPGRVDRKVTDQDIDSDFSEDDEYLEDEGALAKKAAMSKGKPRSSVSAEAYGQFNKKGSFVARVIPKTESQKEKIRKRLSQAFMFAALEPKEREIVIDAMEERKIKAGEYVIKQGEDGDNLYVVESGFLDCFKIFSGEQYAKKLKTYEVGESFGELALLYNAPRAASIVAKSESLLFALDRATFNNIVKDSAIKRRERFEQSLAKIELLQTMDPYERSKIADSVHSVKFNKGEYIIKQGEQGDTFYFVEDGYAVATKILQGQTVAQEVYKYKPGDYFGELSLLKNAPRAANVIAESDMTLLALDRMSFTRVLGPLEEILKRNMGQYEKYM
jgi:cAMP-dependent protein kinase regulator